MKIKLATGGLWVQLLILLGFSLARGFSQSTPACDPPPSGIVNWWQAEGNATDIIGGGTGTLYPGTTYAPGEVGQAFAFDGVNGCVMNTSTPALTYIQNSFTIEFWANPQKGFIIPPQSPDYLNDAGQSFAIFPDWGGTSGPAGVGVCVGTNGIAVMEHAYNYLPSLLSYTNALNGWVHIAVVYVNKQPSLYVNGVWVQTGLASTRSYVYPSKTFGGSYDTSAGPFNFEAYGPYQGLLDEISIYDRALSATEIQAIYAAGSAGKCYAGSAPVITSQPAGLTVNVNADVTLSVAAAGSPVLSYQWSLNGTNLPGANNSSLVLNNIQSGNAGEYAVVVTNLYGSATSSNALLTVLAFPPTFTTQPQGATVNAGSNVTFSASVTGTAPLNFQWSLNGTNLTGATNSTLALANVRPINAGNYAVTVANAYGLATSSNALLTVLTYPPTIVVQPASQTVTADGNATLSVLAAGTAPLNYQWSFNGTNLTGAGGSSLTIADVQSFNAGAFQVTVSSIYGSAVSSNAVLTVLPAPPCDPPPSGIADWWPANSNADDIISGGVGTLEPGTGYTNGVVGQAFSFDGVNGCVMNDDTAPLTYIQNAFTIEFWAYPQKSFNMLPEGGGLGTSGQSYAIFPDWGSSAGANNGPAGVGVCVGTNGISVLAHTAGYLPSLLSYPVHITNWVHVAIVFTNKQPTLFLNGVNVHTGVASVATYVYPSKNLGGSYDSAAGYSFKYYGPYKGLLDEVSIYNRPLAAGEIQAIYAAGSGGKCTPSNIPVVTLEPTNETVAAGGTATFTFAASGLPQLTYQWSFNGTNISGATNTSLTLSNLQAASSGAYLATVANAYGSATTSVATLTVVLPPSITQQPQSQTVLSYNSASFSVVANGTGPFSYQWQKNGVNLTDGGNVSGSATATLTLASVSLADAANYDVLVSNPYSTTNSAVAVLTVPETVLSIGSTNAMSGDVVTVPVWMNALGVENIFSASVGYDPTKLVLLGVQLGQSDSDAYLQTVDTQTNNGYVGLAVYFSSVIPTGPQQVAQLVFQALPVTNTATANLTIGDVPLSRQLVDDIGDSLPLLTQSGTVTLAPAEYEADVYPRFNGDHQVNLQDWLEEGRMVAGLDVPTNSDELLRADCAPRNAPDGVLTVADWVQAGRYALGLDPLTLVGTEAPTPEIQVHPRGITVPTRTLQIATVSASRGQTVSVPVQLVCTTNENAAGLTVNFNPALLNITGVTLGSAMAGGRLNFNTNVTGKVGLVLALPPGNNLLAGTNQVAVLQFFARTNAANSLPLTLNSSLVVLQVADKTANSLTANYVSGAVVLPSAPTLQVTATGKNLTLTWPVGLGTYQVLAATNLAGPWQPLSVVISTNGVSVTTSVTVTNKQQYFRLSGE